MASSMPAKTLTRPSAEISIMSWMAVAVPGELSPQLSKRGRTQRSGRTYVKEVELRKFPFCVDLSVNLLCYSVIGNSGVTF